MTQQQLIDQIHTEFDTAQDRLLSQANEILAKPIDMNQTPIESIGERLKKVGFVNVPTAKKADTIKQNKEAVKKQLVETREEAELIEYYKRTYPFLKFLTESELDRICTKYKLVYAPSANYINEVPEKNLRDIETAQGLKKEDSPKELNYFSGEIWCTHDYVELTEVLRNKCKNLKSVQFTPVEEKPFVNIDTWLNDESRIAIGVLNSLGIPVKPSERYVWLKGSVETSKRDGLFIAAPESHFNTQGLTKKGLGLFNVFKTEIKDPIVFRYVRGGVQVITKWGLEANDPALVVPILN